MKQPKKVQRRVQEDVECTETQLLLTIDMKAINEEMALAAVVDQVKVDGVQAPTEEVLEKKQDEKMDQEENKDDEQ